MNHFALIKSMKPIIEKMNDLSSISPTIEGKTPSFKDGIQISNLSFAYDTNYPVIKGVDLQIDCYKKYAIMGASGCGKSTLVKLLLGHYQDFKGDIHYDHEDIRIVDSHQLHDLSSIIQQNVYMFDETIKDNICLH